MPKYLVRGTFTTQGLQGLLRESGTARRDATEKAVRSVGGTLEALYYVIGDDDAIWIIDVPDASAIAAIMFKICAAGAVSVKPMALITPEEVDKALATSVDYQPPGQ